MSKPLSNVILIGMPGSGKSTVGVLLAKKLGKSFVDTDLLIQSHIGRTLQDIVNGDGYVELRRIEERVLLGLDLRGHVVATGGSAVYSPAAMKHLRSTGACVFLHVDLLTLKARVDDYETRGIAKRPDQTIEELFEERSVLYRTYADITIDCMRAGHEEVCAMILNALRSSCRTS